MTTAHAPETLLEHAAFVRGVARAVLRGDDLVDDAVQETWVVALSKDESRRGPLRPWLGGIARRTALRLLRRRARGRRRDREGARDESQPAVDDLAARAESGRRVVDAVLALEEPYRTTLLLRYYDDVAPKDIATRQGVPYETVRTRLKRGLRRLRTALGQSHDDERKDWRAALLPLALGPEFAVPAPPPLLTTIGIGGGLAVKKVAALALVAALLLIGALVWSPWASSSGDRRAETANDTTELAMATDPGVPGDAGRLEGLPNDDGAQAPAEPIVLPIDFASVDRDRDLHGTVLGDGNRPVGGARVQVVYYPWRDGSLTVELDLYHKARLGPAALTAADGTFRIALEPGDLVYLRVEAEGYQPLERSRLQAGERVTIRLSDGIRLTVKAKTAEGKPADGVRLHLFPGSGTKDVTFGREGVTDARGVAIFDGLPDGTSVTVAVFPQHEGQGSPLTDTVELPNAGEMVHEIDLVAGWILRGRVTDAISGAPIEAARVSRWWNLLGDVRTDADGSYALPGTFDHPQIALHVVAAGYARTVTVIDGARTLDVVLQPGHVLTGRIVDARGNPVAGALLRVFGGRPPQWVRDVSLGAGSSGEDGRFTIGGLAGDIPHSLFVKARGHGKTIVDFDPAESGTVRDLGDVALSAPCTIAGRVLTPDGVPLADVEVTVQGWNADRTERRGPDARPIDSYYGSREHRRTDDLGRYCVQDLSPGTYSVRIEPDGQLPVEREIELGESAQALEVDLVLRPQRQLIVTALDDAGEPVPDLDVYVYTEMRSAGQGRTDPTGRATFTVDCKPCVVAVIPKRGSPYLMPDRREVRADESEVEVLIRQAALLSGRLVDEKDEPLTLGYVTARRGEKRWSAMAQAEGSFIFRLPPGGPVTLRFEGHFQDKDQRNRSYCHPLLAELENVPADADDVILRARPVAEDRTLRVRLLAPDGRPVPDTPCLVTWWRPGKEGAKVVTDANGRATFEGLPPLRVRAYPSWQPTRDAPWIAPSTEYVVPDGQEVVIRLRPGAVIEGTVKASDGIEMQKIFVRASRSRTSTTLGYAYAGADGRFALVLDPDTSGPFVVRAYFYDERRRTREAMVEGVRLGDPPLELTLPPPGE